MRRWLVMLLVFLSASLLAAATISGFSGPATAATDTTVTVMVAGQPVKLAGTTVNGQAVVGLRELVRAYGGTIAWDHKNKVATVKLGSQTILFPAGQAKAVVGGKELPLPVSTRIIKGRTMVAAEAAAGIMAAAGGTTPGQVTPAASAARPGYAGSETCGKCHADIYNEFIVSGHPWKLRPAAEARYNPLPLPKGYTWDDISYVIGGYKWKARYMDKTGKIITANADGPGKNQYNLATGKWSDYEAGKDKPYDCGSCHTTGYTKEGHQDGLPGIIGTWAEPGIGCEACHGPGAEHARTADKAKIKVDTSSALCGQCHIRGSKDTIPAKNGFIEHHEQYNELLASPHAALSCVTCHNPHKKAEFSIKPQGECGSCHSAVARAYADKPMAKMGVTCVDCHMPAATKSAVNFGPNRGDVKTHLFRINTDPAANMFSEDGKSAKGFVTLNFACLSCHQDKDAKWAAEKAAGVH